MEFLLKQVTRIEIKTEQGVEIYHTYKFRGTVDANKAAVSVRSEKELDLNEGDMINIDFKSSQTKIKK